MSESAYNAAASLATTAYQADIAYAITNLTGAAHVTALRVAERARHRRLYDAAKANGMTLSAELMVLEENPAPADEAFTRTDDTTFALVGGSYAVTVAGTFAEGGTVELVDADSNVRLTFTEAGSAAIDLYFGTYHFVLTDVTDATLTIGTAAWNY